MLSDVEELLDVVENIHSSVMLLFSSAWQEWQGVTSDTHVAVEETERESEDQTNWEGILPMLSLRFKDDGHKIC